MDKLLFVSEVSKRLNCSKPMVYSLINEGQLKGIKLGGRGYRVAESSLKDFLKRSEVIPQNIETI